MRILPSPVEEENEIGDVASRVGLDDEIPLFLDSVLSVLVLAS